MPTGTWYYAKDNRQIGPVDHAVLRDLIARGVVGPADLVWTEGMPNWRAAATIPELQTPQSPAAPSYAAPQYGMPAGGMRPQSPYPLLYARSTRYAGFWLRVVAVFIDWIVLMIPGSMIVRNTFLWPNFRLPAPGSTAPPIIPTLTPASSAAGLTMLVAAWLYFALMESSALQGTLGKLALGLKVTDMQGQRISFGRATGRYFGKFVSGLILYIGFLMAAFTARKQALHDLMAETLVVRKEN
ncbi:MAG TPA: RDD family protein [Tepidisphaeraceae bacterium]|nr:RDD family protein [Tepidisphaeraceae bacterium]